MRLVKKRFCRGMEHAPLCGTCLHAKPNNVTLFYRGATQGQLLSAAFDGLVLNLILVWNRCQQWETRWNDNKQVTIRWFASNGRRTVRKWNSEVNLNSSDFNKSLLTVEI